MLVAKNDGVPSEMKVLTVMNPWATLIRVGAKRIETRSYDPKYRGWLLIHASARMNAEAERVCQWDIVRAALNRNGVYRAEQMYNGCIVAKVMLDEVVRVEQCVVDSEDVAHISITVEEEAFGDYSPGRFAWVLSDLRVLDTPIPARGQLGLWNYDMEDGA